MVVVERKSNNKELLIFRLSNETLLNEIEQFPLPLDNLRKGILIELTFKFITTPQLPSTKNMAELSQSLLVLEMVMNWDFELSFGSLNRIFSIYVDVFILRQEPLLNSQVGGLDNKKKTKY
jgi:hypothetical protein